jgi:4-hydroxy-2-oxoheptanedioate aldolase
MRRSIVKAKLRRNEPALITCLHLTDPSIWEMAGMMGFDGIWMDMEHHGYSVETAQTLMRATRVGQTDCMVRPAKGEYMRMGRLLESGALGVMYPRCDDPKEAAEVVRWMKFAPMGTRGFDGANPDCPYCAMDIAPYVKMANDETWLVIQIEDEKALDRAEEIAAVPGVDVLLLGQADFSILSGVPGQFGHQKIQKALEKLGKAAEKHGKHWGTPVGTAERAKQLMDMGSKFICHGADLIHVMNGFKAIQQNFGQLGFTFNNQFAKEAHSYMEKS